MRHTRAHPEDNNETYHSITIAHHKTYQSQPRQARGYQAGYPEHTQSQPRQAIAHPEDNTETYQSITIAHHETYQSQPEDTKAGHETPQSIPHDTLRAVLSDFICGLNMIVPRTN